MRKQIIACALTGILTLGIVGCGQQPATTETKAEEKTEQVQPAEETAAPAIEWTAVQTSAEAAQGAGLEGFGVPESVTVDETTFSSPKFSYTSNVAQATYEQGATALIVRKATVASKQTENLSERKEDEFDHTWNKKYEDLKVVSSGPAKGAAVMMVWTDGDYEYGVTYQGLGGDEMTMDSDAVAAVVKAIKDANAVAPAATEQKQETATSSTTTSTTSNGATNIDGFDVTVSASQATQIACDYAGAGGQAKGEALNLSCSDPITGGGTVYYVVTFNLGEVAYEVQVDAVDGNVISASQTFDGVQQLLDDDGVPIDGTEVEVQ